MGKKGKQHVTGNSFTKSSLRFTLEDQRSNTQSTADNLGKQIHAIANEVQQDQKRVSAEKIETLLQQLASDPSDNVKEIISDTLRDLKTIVGSPKLDGKVSAETLEKLLVKSIQDNKLNLGYLSFSLQNLAEMAPAIDGKFSIKVVTKLLKQLIKRCPLEYDDPKDLIVFNLKYLGQLAQQKKFRPNRPIKKLVSKLLSLSSSEKYREMNSRTAEMFKVSFDSDKKEEFIFPTMPEEINDVDEDPKSPTVSTHSNSFFSKQNSPQVIEALTSSSPLSTISEGSNSTNSTDLSLENITLGTIIPFIPSSFLISPKSAKLRSSEEKALFNKQLSTRLSQLAYVASNADTSCEERLSSKDNFTRFNFDSDVESDAESYAESHSDGYISSGALTVRTVKDAEFFPPPLVL